MHSLSLGFFNRMKFIWVCVININTGKTQAIWFAQVVNSLILKVTDISKFAMKISNYFSKLDSHKSRKLAQGKFVVGQGKHREFENAI